MPEHPQSFQPPSPQEELECDLQLVAALLAIHEDDKPSQHQHNGTRDTILSCGEDEGYGEFFYCRFDDQEESRFQRFMEEWVKDEQQAVEGLRNQRRTRKATKKPHQIGRIGSPKTVLNWYGVQIEVVYKNYQQCKATCLVMPYESISPKNLKELGLNKQVISMILEEYDNGAMASLEQDGEVLHLRCKHYWKDYNYQWLYLTKKPQYKYMAEYAAKKLEEMVRTVLKICCGYGSTESVVIPDFGWIGLEDRQKCEIFLWTLIKCLYEQLSIKKVNLKRITICCSNQTSFFNFTYKLRQIIDLYMINGLIAL